MFTIEKGQKKIIKTEPVFKIKDVSLFDIVSTIYPFVFWGIIYWVPGKSVTIRNKENVLPITKNIFKSLKVGFYIIEKKNDF